MSDPVEAYFAQLRDIRASGAGVAETTYYPAVKALLDEVGKHLKPKVTALMQLRNAGAGIPDGGLFTAGQLKGWEPGVDPLAGQMPQRGAIEVKGTGDDAFAVAKSEQVARYVERYGLVLVTNLRDFVLVGRSADGAGVRELESCRLAETEAGFWAKAGQPRKYAEAAGEGLLEFLRRALLHDAPLADPKDLAWFLASYARTARLRLEQKHELPALDSLRSQLEESLGLKFEGEKGDHFFRSTLVQTLFYGMFASWVLWARDRDHTVAIDWRDRFQWETATATLHVPMVYELFRQFADVRQLGALGISEVLEWAEEVIWRIDREAFFQKFREDHAVQYFYEPFLEAFDPQLRKELGVWYTPDEVVKYMVARVDTVLREELGIADGLADPSVVVLDPCCGTGAYLVEVLRKIDETLTAKGADALTRNDVKQAAMHRVIGFEIMPAPYVVAHLQMGILLAELGVPLRDADERAAIYLTNALTGWGDAGATPPKDKRVHPGQLHSTLLFPEFAEERNAADRVKREEQVLVVIGNPPYNRYAGIATDETRDLSDAYRTTRVVAKPQGMGLNDLYVRFFRLAERQIVERSPRGVVCLISNNSWLDGLSFTGMRERLFDAFEGIWIDNLNGDKYKTGKLTPEGKPDPSVFSTEKNREGIQVGAAIVTLVHGGRRRGGVAYRDWWGAGKRADLGAACGAPGRYEVAVPEIALGLPFRPAAIAAGYLSWPRLTDLSPTAYPGVSTARDDFLVDVDEDALEDRISRYFDPSVTDAEMAAVSPKVMQPTQRFDAYAVRRVLVARGRDRGAVVRVAYRPFDVRWLYWDPDTKLVDEKRPPLFAASQTHTAFLVAQQKPRREWSRPQWVTSMACLDLMDRGAQVFPLALSSHSAAQLDTGYCENLTEAAGRFVRKVGGAAEDVMLHAMAILHSPRYAEENAGALLQDWPRVPLPAGTSNLSRSANLGREVAALLDTEVAANWAGAEARLRWAGVLSGARGQALGVSDLGLTARWGTAGTGGVTMPSTGKRIEREYTADERAALAEGAESLGLSADQAIALLGDTCFDVYLNDVAYWRCVPANVWRYTIGGYQVIKKWLSYRERALLGRDLKPEEARYVTEMVRRIAALVLMQPELDANYECVKADAWEWGELA